MITVINRAHDSPGYETMLSEISLDSNSKGNCLCTYVLRVTISDYLVILSHKYKHLIYWVHQIATEYIVKPNINFTHIVCDLAWEIGLMCTQNFNYFFGFQNFITLYLNEAYQWNFCYWCTKQWGVQ